MPRAAAASTQSGMRLPRRNDVERIDRLRGEHRIGIAIDVRDGKFLARVWRPWRRPGSHTATRRTRSPRLRQPTR